MRRRPARSLMALVAVALACGPAVAHAAPPLIGQWPLDGSYEDGASQVTDDVSGNGLALRAPNGSVHLGSPALFGSGATLGTNLTPMQVTSPLLAPAQVTLLAWIRQNGNPGTLRYLAGRGDDGLTCGGSAYALYTGYPAKPGLRFYARTAGAPSGALTDAPADGAVFDGRWHLVAGTYDGTATRLYVDGVLAGSPVPAPPPLVYGLGGGTSFYVDGYPVEGCALGLNADDWPGAIDEVRVYDRALSAGELARLARAAGPTAPALVTDASLVPAPAPGPQASAPGPVGRALERAAVAGAVAAVAGASRRAPTEAAQAALASVRDQALEAMKTAADRSRVGAATPAQGLSAKEAKATDPDPRIQARLDAMRFGLATQVPAGAQGRIVEAAATIALEREIAGKIRTQTIVLPPAAGVAAGASGRAELQFPVDARAAAAMGRSDVARAAVSVQAVAVDGASALGEQQALKLQQALDARTKAAATLTNVLKKMADAQRAITENLRGGVSPPERSEQQALNEKLAKLTKQAQAIEKARDAANQKATAAMKDAVAGLIAGLAPVGVPGAPGNDPSQLPAGTTSLAGCTVCRFGALASK